MQRLIVEQRDKTEGEKTRKVISWLSSLNFWAKQIDTFQRRQPGTGQWFLTHPTFESWSRSDHAKVLWCPGARIVPIVKPNNDRV